MLVLLLAAVGFAGGWAWADDAAVIERPPSALTLDGGRDSAGGSFGGFDAGIGLGYGDLVFAGYSSSRVKSSLTGETSITRSSYAGYTFRPQGRWSFTPSLESWGARSDLTTRAVLVDTTLNLEDWSFGLQPEFKSLIWTSADDPDVRRRTGAFGLHGHAEYYGARDWTFELRAGGTGYGGQRFNRFLYSYVVSDSAFAQSSGLVKSYYSAAVRYKLGDWRFTLKAQQSSYLVDGARSASFSAGFKWHFHPHWRAGYLFSSNKPSDGTAISSNSLNLAFEW